MSRLFEIINGDQVRRLEDPALPLAVGQGDAAEIVLDGAPGIVAYVGESRSHLFLQPADGAPRIYHNDVQVTRSVWLKAGDVTRVGTQLLHWHISGQRIELRVVDACAVVMTPPEEPPHATEEPETAEGAPPSVCDESSSAPARRYLKPAVVGLFLLLLFGAAFVLLAKPLRVTVTPAPDSVDIEGFPPVMAFGTHHLGIIGDYRVRATLEGYQPLDEVVTITAHGGQYVFSMVPLPGQVDVTSTPGGATLLIDGDEVGATPLSALEVAAGTHLLRFEHPRYLPAEQTLEVEGFGKPQQVQAELEPAWAIYRLTSEPPGATVSVDGEAQGVTPLELELIDGERELTLTLDGYVPASEALEVQAGADRELPVVKLEPAPAAVSIRSRPAGAAVLLDGTYRGQSPLDLAVTSRITHNIELSKAGYRTARRELTLNAAEEQTLEIDLEPEYGTLFISATPPDAALRIDGKRQETANGRFRLTTRTHILTLEADGFETLSRKVTPRSAYSQRLDLALVRKGQAAPAATTAPRPAPGRTTGLGQQLVRIDPQPFVMGASRNEAGRRANEAEHEVALKRSFYIAAKEVTNAEYRRFRSQHASGLVGNRSLEIDSHPVVNVSWDDAARYLNWLSRQDGLPPFYQEVNGAMVAAAGRGPGYRLPSEAEWAYAARMAGRKERARYPWPGKYPPQGKPGNFADESARHLLPVVIQGYNDGYAATAPVGSFPANPVGLFDLGGNVAEWSHDFYAASPGRTGKGEVDPMGPDYGSHHVVRGASWRNASITELRFSYRRYSREPSSDIGFRIARYVQ